MRFEIGMRRIGFIKFDCEVDIGKETADFLIDRFLRLFGRIGIPNLNKILSSVTGLDADADDVVLVDHRILFADRC